MRQHSIDLMPISIRTRTKAGVRRGRFFAIAAMALTVTALVATHSRLKLAGAERLLQDVQAETTAVLALDREATLLKRRLHDLEAFVQLHQKLAIPLDVSAVIATLINALPESVTLDQLDLDAGARTVGRSPRSKGFDAKDGERQRLLFCEVWGFAASDEDIAHLVTRLESTSPFKGVNLDFSRTKKVNDRDAREFRLSFKIDLTARYDVAFSDLGPFAQEGGDE